MASTSSGSLSHKLRKDFHSCWLHFKSNRWSQTIFEQTSSKRFFFYNVRVVNMTTKESAALVIQEVSIFWQKARIPTRRTDHCIDKLVKFYNEWKHLQKNLSRTAGKEKEKEIFLWKLWMISLT